MNTISHPRRIREYAEHFLRQVRRSAAVRSPETEQAVLRLGIGTLVLLYVLFFPLSGPEFWDPSILAAGFFLIGFFLLLHIVLKPGDFPWRKSAGVFNDIFFITVSLYIAGRDGQPIYLVYLWVIFGNGFRYGRAYLNLALTLSLIGFACIMLATPYWREHNYQALTMLVSLALLSGYFGTLLKRLTDVLKAEEAANKAKRQFISSVSHELRTPLNAIIGITDLLQTTKVTPDQKEMLATLKSSSKMMHALIDDVLDFSKIEAGKLTISHAPFDLHELAHRSVDMFRHQADKRGVRLQAEVADAVPGLLTGDAHHLRQVLINLLSNAVKFTREGSIVLRVVPESGTGQRIALRFEVQDTGIGIDPVAQKSIFDSFTQASPAISQQFGGTGLGTTIAQQLVGLMGGRIELQSQLGKGSTFFFTLEFAIAEAEPAAMPFRSLATPAAEGAEDDSTTGKGTGTKAPIAGLHVLVADDNPVNQSILQRVLERAGHEATVVSNGDEALDRLEVGVFDAVVLDMHMPVLDGLETVKAYRLLTAAEFRIPVIIFSADANIETERECLEAGADAFLSKPIDVDRFLGTLGSLASRAGARPRKRTTPAPGPRELVSSMVSPAEAVESTALDYTVLAMLESIGQRPEFVDSLIDSFCSDSELNLRRLGSFLQAGDVAQFQAVAHAMQGSAAGIGATSLEQCCRECRSIGAGDFTQSGQAAYQAVRTEYAAASHALNAYKRRRSQPVSMLRTTG